jgi:GAF domain-containing protein
VVDSRTRESASALQTIGVRSFVNMLLIEEGGTVALLYVNHAAPREWREEELAFMRDVAERTRIAVERRRSEHSLHWILNTPGCCATSLRVSWV